MIYTSTKQLQLAEACVDGANRAVFSFRQRQKHAMAMKLRIGEKGTVGVDFGPRGIVRENGGGEINLFADEPIFSAPGVDRLLVQHIQRRVHGVQMRVEDFLAMGHVRHAGIREADALRGRVGQIERFDLTPRRRQKIAAVIAYAGVQPLKFLRIDLVAILQSERVSRGVPVRRELKSPRRDSMHGRNRRRLFRIAATRPLPFLCREQDR